MAAPLDLQEQEQLDALKAFWKTYGNLITWVLIALLGAYGAWNGWQWWQREQAHKAGAMFEELDRSIAAGEAERAARIFGDLRERYGSTAQAQHGGLATAKLQFDKGQLDAARATLGWVAEQGRQDELRAVARLRLAGIEMQAGKFAEALAQLDAIKVEAFAGLAADRRGDVLTAQGKAAEAKAAYQAAYQALPESNEFRRVVEAKLTALGAAPAASGAAK